MTQQEFFERYSFNVRTDKIGGGSFGTVYRAYDNTRDREVAIKVSEVREMGGKEFSLRDEFKAIGKLPVHANIAHYEEVFTFESPQGVFDYAVMQYYKEGNLSSFLENHPGLSFMEREGICMAILDGIAHLHHHKVVHRDLKPGNILVVTRKNGAIVPKITDFGLSKQAGTDSKASRFTNSFAGGTLMYSSPEQIRGEKLHLNTDLWSFGAIAYEVLTGEQLFQVDGYTSASAEWQNQMTQTILKADMADKLKELPEKWRNALSQCLQREHEKRVKSTDDINDVLLGLAGSSVNTGSEPTIVDPVNDDVTQVSPKTTGKEYKPKRSTPSMAGTRPKAKAKKWPYALALGVVAVVAGFGIWSFVANPDEDNINENQISLFQQDGVYGYKVKDSIFIEPKYVDASIFIEGKAKVADSTGIFYVNQKDEVVEKLNTKEQEELDNWYGKAMELYSRKKFKESIKWFRKGAENWHATSQAALGLRFGKGEGVQKNQDSAIYWLKKGGLKGIPFAQTSLGFMYYHGDGVEKDENIAFQWYLRASNNNDPRAQVSLASMYFEGEGPEGLNNLKGIKWMTRAAEDGSMIAQFSLGTLFMNAEKGLKLDYSKAKYWLEKSCSQGYPYACTNVELVNSRINSTKKGNEVPNVKDYLNKGKVALENNSNEEAELWLKKASDNGNIEAKRILGDLKQGFFGGEKNEKEALNWYKDAAKNGDGKAMFKIGSLYEFGFGVSKNINEAIFWFEKAGKSGYAEGYYRIGTLYYYQKGGLPDDNQKIKFWYNKACSKGFKEASSEMEYLN